MKKQIQVLIPMSGQGTRYQKAGFKDPKPLIPIDGVPMIERLLEKFPIEWPATFVLADNHRETNLESVLRKIRPNARILWIPQHTKGPSHAAQFALSSLQSDAPVLVSYCDYGLVWDPWDFQEFTRETDCDAALVSYRGFHPHLLSATPYATSRMEGEFVREVKEKGSFTANRENEFTSAGAYYFKSPALLKKAIEAQEALDLSLNGEFYTSLSIEALLRTEPRSHIRCYEIPAFFQWGTPEDLKTFEYWNRTFRNLQQPVRHSEAVSQILMPMAGLGSRFRQQFKTPKPFLRFMDRPMFRHALRTLPPSEKVAFVALESCRDWIQTAPSENIKWLEETPAGQALSVESGLEMLSGGKDVIVSACDHGIALSPTVWRKFRAEPACDAAIFTVTGFPGATRSPKSFAYVETQNETDSFPLVRRVSVKEPISEHPDQDRLLVGTFWFRSAEILKTAVDFVKKADAWVNGELYLDSAFNELIRHGLKVRAVSLDGYVNWGDPDSLSEALYWSEVHFGRKGRPRQKLDGVEG